MASTMPVENWGQLKFVEVDADKAAGNNENDGTASDACMHIQLQSLPKGDERDRATYVPRPLLSIPITVIASASGTTRNDVSLVLRPHSSVSRDESSSSGGGSSNAQQMTAIELTGVRFAVPNICVGYEQTEEAGKVVLQEVQQQMQVAQRRLLQSHARQRGDGGATGGSAATAADGHSDDASLLLLATLGGGGGGARADERAIAVFDDATLSYPAGKYKMLVSNYHVVLEDKKRGATSGLTTLPLSNIQQIYLCDVPTHFAKASSSSSAAADDDDAAEQQTLGQYVVLILKAPLKIRSTSYAHLVISCPANMVLDEEHAWQCELQTQEEINRVLGGGGGGGADNSVDVGLTPRMSGKVSEILVRVFKAVARVPAYGGSNKEYRSVLTQRRHCCMRCLFHGTEGLLYIVNSGFLFLHRPATLLRFDEVDRVEMDEAESGKATFQLNVYSKAARSSSAATSGGGGGSERYTFSAIDKEEKEGLLSYLNKKGKLVRRGITVDDDDEDSDDDEDEDDDSDESDSSDDGDSDDDEDSDDEDSDDEDEAGGGGKHAKKRRHKHTKSKTKEDKTAGDGNKDKDGDGDDTASRTKEKKKKHSKEEGHKHKHRHHKHKHRHHRDRKRDRDDADKDGDGDDAKRQRHHRHHHDKKSKKSAHEADDA